MFKEFSMARLVSFRLRNIHIPSKIFKRFVHNANREKYSYFCGSSQDSLLSYTVGQCLDVTASKFGDREAVVVCHQNLRKTYSSFKNDVDKVASGLISLDLKKGDRIGIWSPNNYEWVVTQFASAKAGLISVCVNPGYKSKELEYCLKKVGMKAIVSADSFKTQNFYDILRSLMPSLSETKSEIIEDERFPYLRHVIMLSDKNFSGTIKFSDLYSAGRQIDFDELKKLQKKIQFDDPVNIQFTSGTTGNPKGATLTHHNIVNNAYYVGKRLGYNQKLQRVCIPTPLYHCVGCVLGTLASTIHGACAILPSPVFNSKETIQAIHKEKATSVYGTPTMYIDILNLPDFNKYDFTSLERGIMTGSPCPEEVLRETIQKMNIKNLTICYGCTETSPVILQTSPKDSFENRTQTVGLVLDHVEVKIVNKEGEIVPCGVQGELLARGYLVMHSYWNDKIKTEESITSARWYKTGDLATFDENGYGRIIGRIKDMVIRGGENIYPREIEEVLHSNENIAEAQVIGVPDKRMGEELCAWVKLKDNHLLSENDVKVFCKDKMAHFKIPRYIIFTDEFPKTVTGKIQKFLLREESIKKLNLN